MTTPKILRITARPPAGFRRAGLLHPATPVDHDAATFTDEQLQALLHEPKLVVELIDAPTLDTSRPPSAEVPAGESAPAGPATSAAPAAPAVEVAPAAAAASAIPPAAKPDAKPAAAPPKKGKGK